MTNCDLCTYELVYHVCICVILITKLTIAYRRFYLYCVRMDFNQTTSIWSSFI